MVFEIEQIKSVQWSVEACLQAFLVVGASEWTWRSVLTIASTNLDREPLLNYTQQYNEGDDVKKWRKFTWFILVVQVLFVIWIISGVSAVSDSCDGLTGTDLDICQAGTAVGAGIGIGLILFLWGIVDVILAVIWLVTGRSGNKAQKD